MSKRSYVPWRPLGEPSVVALAETFKVLGDVTRVRILDALARVRGAGAPGSSDGICVQDLANVLGMTQSAVSHQLRLLRSMRLVRTRRDGRQIFYALDDDHIVKLFEQGLEHVNERTAAPAATPRRGRRNPRRGVSESARRGWGPGASARKAGEG
jgi:ArsR family transcriptional regulator, lead/cadmium/zinc/bismuth-responsive transcriptional repressor